MKNRIFVLGAVLLMIAAWSCRQESDALMGYDQNELLLFNDAKKSFAAQFEVLWNGMNQYYAIWDYEKEQGVDWDAVYDECYPLFVALDQKGVVTDDELTELMYKAFGRLHDGHLWFTMTNYTTGSKVTFAPNMVRVMQRADYASSRLPLSMSYYADPANGEVETDVSGRPIAMEYTTDVQQLMGLFATTPGIGLSWMNDRKAELEALAAPTDLQAFELEHLNNLSDKLGQLKTMPLSDIVDYWNSLQLEYSFLGIPGFVSIDKGFEQSAVDVKYALLKGNIAYFRLNSFALTMYLDDAKTEKEFNMSNADTRMHVQQVRQVWQSWFDAIQQLHKNGTLGGVIIDLRNNGGGLMDDSRYVVGALVPPGGILFSYQRFKRGTGRYEYSPMMPASVLSMSAPHEVITEPLVILGNCMSVSMSESSILSAKTFPNATFIGKRTFGAICALTTNEYNSYSYAGFIGVENVTPVFGHVPSMASYTLEGKLIEATGIAPDIDVDLDVNLLQTTGRDSQLERALQFIRTGQ